VFAAATPDSHAKRLVKQVISLGEQIMARMEKMKSKNTRFVLNDQGRIFDILHPEQLAEVPWHVNPVTGKPYNDEVHLRNGVLVRRLDKLVPELTRGNGTKKQKSSFAHHVGNLLPRIIQASQLNRRDARVSMQHPFKRKLKHRKTLLRELTSISLFIDDVERLLRDLYGDIDGDDLNEVVAALTSTVVALSEYVLPDLASEYHTASTIDLGSGRAVEPGYGVSKHEVSYGVEAAQRLILRAREVLSSFPHGFGRYTLNFAKALKENWPAFKEWRPLAKTWPEAIRGLAMRSKYLREVA
jgi:hypothetical protein